MTRPAAKDVSPLGFLGLGVALIGLIIGFVVAAEYDPESADFRDAAVDGSGMVVSVNGPTGLDLLVAVNTEPYEIEVRADQRWRDRFDPADRVRVVWLPDDPTSGRLDSDVPFTPRRATDAIAPLVILLLGAAMITFDPTVLYLGLGPREGEVAR
ncbi:MAG: hypothetical protein GY929_17520 [Actinomycetia bacterium]|nr:hypothetical protein [Actinomycetes bacterium]